MENEQKRYEDHIAGRNAVTEADVPVLLSEMQGRNFSVDEEKVILHSWNWDGQETYFCREDHYAEIAEYVREGIDLNTYYYTYWPKYENNPKDYYLTEEQAMIVDKLVGEIEFVDMYYNFTTLLK